MFIDVILLTLAFFGGGFVTFKLIELLSADQSGIAGALFLSSVMLSALFTLTAFIGVVLAGAARSILSQLRKQREAQDRMVQALEAMESRTRSAEQVARQRL